MAHCPYCNSELTTTSTRQSGERLLCVCCGEPLPATVTLNQGNPEAQASSSHVPATAATNTPSGWSNRKIAFTVLTVMLFMGAVGLTYALVTQNYRRANDYRAKKQKDDGTMPIATGDLVGLGHLPRGVNVVAAVRVHDLLKTPATQKLLAAPRPAVLDSLIGGAEKWAGLRMEELDHVVLGTELQDHLPQLVLVLHTLKPYDPLVVAKAMQPNAPALHRGGLLYRFSPGAGEGMLWCVGPRTIVVLVRFDAVTSADLGAIPTAPVKASDILSKELLEIMEKPALKPSLAWIAGRLEQPQILQSLALLAPKAKDEIRVWSQVRAFGLGILPQEGVTLIGQFHVPDKGALATIQQRLEAIQPENVKSYKIEAPPADVTDPQDQWLALQLRADSEQLRAVLGRLGAGWLRRD